MEHIIKEELLKLSQRVFVFYIPEENALTDVRLPNLSIVSQTKVSFDSEESIQRFIEEYQIIQDIKNGTI